MIGKTISHYKILGKIGEGGRGVVYKAEDLDLKRIVALKFISPHLADNKNDLDSLYQEARSASKLNHPNITTIYEIGHSGKHNFITMEYLDGDTLKEKIKRDSFHLDEILDIAIATLEGIKKAHDNNIIHRDIKSENVMLTESGTTKVMDFGLARNLERDNITKISVTLGTIAYMSPEQIEGSKVDQRSDIYSFGVVLYEMLTGRLPFVSEHEAATLYSIVNESPPDISEIVPDADPSFIAIIEKTLEKNPEHRYQNVSELLNDLNELKGGTFKQKFRKNSIKPKLYKKNINGKWLIGGISTLLFLGVVALFFTGNFNTSPQLVKSLAVLNFENMNQPDDPDRLGQILQELIIADLSDMPNLKVFSSQRLFDIQKQLGSENRNSIEANLATDIAQKAGAETMLTGNIIERGANLILTSQLISINDGSIIKSHQVEGNDIYAMVDDLTSLIQTDLQIVEGEDKSVPVAVADKTTSSMNAFQYYFNGVDYFNKSHFDEAIIEFKQAIEIDTTFSSAYYKLAMAQWWSQSELNNETIENAQQSLQKILDGSWYRTTKEKLLAQGALELTKQNFAEAEIIYQQLIDFIEDEKEAWYGIGEAYFHGSQDYEKAAEAFERAIELDPGFTVAYRHIFDIYSLNKEYDIGIIRATQLIDNDPENVWGHIFIGNMLYGKEDYYLAKSSYQEALQIDPDLAIIYKSLSHSYIKLEQYDEGITFANNLPGNSDIPEKYELLANMYLGKKEFENAINIYERALRLHPDDYGVLLSVGQVYLLNSNYNQAMNHCEYIKNNYNDLWKMKGRQLLISVYNELGMYNETIEIFKEMQSDFKESDSKHIADMLNNLAYYEYLAGNSEIANQKLDEALSLTDSVIENLVTYLIKSFVLSGSNELAKLNGLSKIVQNFLINNEDNTFIKVINNAVKFNYYFTSRDYDSALQEFETMDSRDQITHRYYFYAGLAYWEIGNIDKVEEIINKMNDLFLPVSIRSFLFPRSYYLKGLVEESRGNYSQAKQEYQNLLSIWQDGDKNAFDYQLVLQRYNNL